MTICREEIFGPVLCILKFKEVDEVISRVNNTEHGLAGGVVGTNINNVNKISRSIKAGIIYVNHWRAPLYSTPFGGFKQSGIGRELGTASLDAY